MRDLFVSHSTKDSDVARQIVAALEANKVTCWVAPRDVRAGHEYQNEIMEGLRQSNAVLFLHSEEAAKSKHVIREVGLADELGKQIVPVRLTDAPITGSVKYTLANRQWIDFFENPNAAVERILADLPDRGPIRIRSWNWSLPEDKRKSLMKTATRAVIGLAVLSGAAFAGYRVYESNTSLRACDVAAASEYELEDHAGGVGLPDGMIDPAIAIPACRRAVAAHPDVARAHFQLARALEANGYDASVPQQRSVQLGHLEAVLATLTGGSGGQISEAQAIAVQTLSVRIREGDPKAMALAALYVVPSARTEAAETSAPAVADLMSYLQGALSAESAEECAGRTEGYELRSCEAGYRISLAIAADASSEAAMLWRDAARAGLAPAVMRVDRDAAVAQGYAPAVYDAASELYDEITPGADDEGQRLSQYVATVEQLSERGYRPAMVTLARILFTGRERTIDFERAQALLVRAAPVVEGEE